MSANEDTLLNSLVTETNRLATAMEVQQAVMQAFVDSNNKTIEELQRNLNRLSEGQIDHAQRITSAEGQLRSQQEMWTIVNKSQEGVNILKTEVDNLKAVVEGQKPTHTPWTAVAAAVTSIVALAYSILR